MACAALALAFLPRGTVEALSAPWTPAPTVAALAAFTLIGAIVYFGVLLWCHEGTEGSAAPAVIGAEVDLIESLRHAQFGSRARRSAPAVRPYGQALVLDDRPEFRWPLKGLACGGHPARTLSRPMRRHRFSPIFRQDCRAGSQRSRFNQVDFCSTADRHPHTLAPGIARHVLPGRAHLVEPAFAGAAAREIAVLAMIDRAADAAITPGALALAVTDAPAGLKSCVSTQRPPMKPPSQRVRVRASDWLVTVRSRAAAAAREQGAWVPPR